MPRWLPYLIVLLAFELASDAWARQLAGSKSIAVMAGPAALVLGSNIAWQLMLRAGVGLSRGGLLFSVGVAIGVIVIGVAGFGETITPRQGAGLAAGIVAIALLAS